jgi:quercetin dioxygenase-like cupin family protein
MMRCIPSTIQTLPRGRLPAWLLGTVFSIGALVGGGGCAASGDSEPAAAYSAAGAKASDEQSIETLLLSDALAPSQQQREVRVMTVEYEPGGWTPAHHHPGAIYAYVLEGEVMIGLDGKPPVRYRAGQAWLEREGQVHSVSRNASDSRSAKLLVFFVTEPGKPVLELQK